jgi:hypothetical protein
VTETDNRDAEAPPQVDPFVVTCQMPRAREMRYGSIRSIRIRRDPRPKVRRGNGRVGPSPRVVLHRA